MKGRSAEREKMKGRSAEREKMKGRSAEREQMKGRSAEREKMKGRSAEREKWSRPWESNPRPTDYESVALPAELERHTKQTLCKCSPGARLVQASVHLPPPSYSKPWDKGPRGGRKKLPKTEENQTPA